MIRPYQFAAALFAAALICSAAGAQRRGGAMPVRMGPVRIAPAPRPSYMMASPFAVSSASRHFASIRLLPSGQVPSGFIPFANYAGLRGAKGAISSGFGSGYVATPSSGGLRGSIGTRSGRRTRGRQTVVTPIFIGGYPYYYPGDYYTDDLDYAQPLPVDSQQPATVDAGSQDVAPDYEAPAPEAIAPAPPAPVRDIGDFILVRRNGQLIFASAFSVIGDQLRYVTPEGIRRSISMSDVDTDATQQMNEARGTTVQLHN